MENFFQPGAGEEKTVPRKNGAKRRKKINYTFKYTLACLFQVQMKN